MLLYRIGVVQKAALVFICVHAVPHIPDAWLFLARLVLEFLNEALCVDCR